METADEQIDRYQAKIDRLSSAASPDPAKIDAAKAELAAAQQQKAQAQETFLSLQRKNFEAIQAEKKLQDQINLVK
jgi:hypothetical protein